MPRDRGRQRLGLFALRSGQWGKTLWADPGTIQFSTYPTTHFNEMGEPFAQPGSTGRWGYGILWWAGDAPKYPEPLMTAPFHGAFSAMGSGGQFITAFPYNDIVVEGGYRTKCDRSLPPDPESRAPREPLSTRYLAPISLPGLDLGFRQKVAQNVLHYRRSAA